MHDAMWDAADTTPAKVEAALRELERERHAADDSYVPARVLNLVAVVDREWRGEVENRLARVGRYHASRTVLCSVEPRRTKISARVSVTEERDGVRETVTLDVGPQHVPKLDRVVDPLMATDVATAVWAPHGHADAVNALLPVAQVVLHDSVDEPDPRAAVVRASEISGRAYLVDLAWLRTTPWRVRVAAAFDPPAWRPGLRTIAGVTVRHHPDSTIAAVLFLGWLASRLGWTPAPLVGRDGELVGRATGRRQDVRLATESHDQGVRGLGGVTITTADGGSVSLDRGEGGLTARRRRRDGTETCWTVLGASRGEAGILGQGLRQALLRDPTYAPALAAARELVGA
jgi:glucose-6-phosphate dehydrogenase assembly protein OpcA